jgi:hypothetical protein
VLATKNESDADSTPITVSSPRSLRVRDPGRLRPHFPQAEAAPKVDFRASPLQWFGMLPPQELRQAQSHYKRGKPKRQRRTKRLSSLLMSWRAALELSLALASVKARIEALEQRFLEAEAASSK